MTLPTTNHPPNRPRILSPVSNKKIAATCTAHGETWWNDHIDTIDKTTTSTDNDNVRSANLHYNNRDLRILPQSFVLVSFFVLAAFRSSPWSPLSVLLVIILLVYVFPLSFFLPRIINHCNHWSRL